MAKIPAKAKKIDNKTIPFLKKNEKFSNVKLLPEILQTDSNKQIISTTLDNITSRGSLEQINGFVGKKQGGYFKPDYDRYVPDTLEREKYQLSQSPVSYDSDNIYSMLTVDDLKKSLENYNPSTNNWNTQLDVESYTFSPPFNLDKFVNFSSYFWLDDPIFISVSSLDITTVVGKINGSIDNIEVKNGMVFKIATNTSNNNVINLRNDTFIDNTIYIIHGVGDYIELIPFTIDDKQSLFVSGSDENVFPQQFICMEIGAPNRNAWSRTNFWVHTEVIELYKTALAYDSNKSYAEGDWMFENNQFYKKVLTSGNGRLSRGSSLWISKYDIVQDYNNIQAKRPIIEFDNRLEMYDTGNKFLTTVDHWSIFKTPSEIISSGKIQKQWKSIDNEYSPIINDYELQDNDIIVLTGVSSSYRYKIYRFNTNPNTLTEINVAIGDVILFSAQHNTDYTSNTRYVQEYFWNGFQWQNVQLKRTNNQSINFNLYDYEGNLLTTYSNSNFAGSTIFEYSKATTGDNDLYLGYPLEYNNIGSSDFNVNSIGHIQFEYTQQNRYQYILNNNNEEIEGFYFTKKIANSLYLETFNNSWTPTYVKEKTRKSFTKVYTKENFGNDFHIEFPTNSLGLSNEIQVSLDTYCYFTYKEEGRVSLPIQGYNPNLFIPTNQETKIHVSIDPYTFNYVVEDYVDPDYFESMRFKILDQDGNLVTTDIVNNNIHEGTITINTSTEQELIWKLGDNTGKIFITNNFTMPQSVQIYKNNVLQIPGTNVEVENKTKDYYYLDSKTIVFPYYESDDTQYELDVNGSVTFVRSSTDNIPKEGLKLNDVFNCVYTTHEDTKDLFDNPFILDHNWKNEEINVTSYNQLFNHMLNKINSNPMLTGQGLGVNNYYNLLPTNNLGGTIFQFNCNGADSLINFANNNLDIVNGIRFAKDNYKLYKNNFAKTLLNKINSSNNNSVLEIVNDVLKKINLGKTSTDIFFNSSMIYYDGFNFIEEELAQNQTTISLNENIDNKLQHVYVYVEQNTGLNQLIKNIDYIILNSNEIELLTSYPVSTVIKIAITSTNSFSFCAPTPTKLGITPAYVPQYEIVDSTNAQAAVDYYYKNLYNNLGYNLETQDTVNVSIATNEVLRCHDGSLIKVNANLPRFFYDCILEYEKRIYNNIFDIRYTWDKNIDPENYYFKNQNFYSKNLEEKFNKFLFLEKIESLNNFDFDSTDPFTWNYSKLSIPGNYRGIYRYYLGSSTPDKTPWECLGYGSKPNWWDDHYSWLDTANGGDDIKRNALINALIFGYYGNPSVGVGQREDLIRSSISNVINNLVQVNGNLNDPLTSGIITNADLEKLTVKDLKQDWKFNDLSLVELAYRNSIDFIFDYIESCYVTYPILFYRKYWNIKNSLFTNNILNNQYTYENTKIRKYQEISDYHNVDTNTGLLLGINLYCYEYLKFKKIKSDTITNIFANLNTSPLVKLAGFSKKSLLNLKFDTLLNQTASNFIPEEDFRINLYKSNSLKSFFYSNVKILKVSKGYKITGYNPLENYFLIQNLASLTESLSVEISNNLFVQEPTKFNETTQTIKYETVFKSIQEVYTFIIQYGKYLEKQGVITDEFLNISTWRTLGKQFVIWATASTRNTNDIFIVSPNKTKILISLKHGFVDVKNQMLVNSPLVIGENQKLDSSKIKIVREDNVTSILSDYTINGIQLYQKNIEHICLLNNKTKFDDVLYSNLYGIGKPRIKLVGKKTSDWKGKPNANGFIVKNNTIVENLESSASNFNQYNAIENTIANDQLQKTSRYNTGYTKPQYLQNLDIDDDLSYDFYSGTIHNKGTNSVFNKLLRNKDLFLKDSNFQINTKEEWLFRLGEFGDVEGQQTLEFEMPASLVKTNPQVISFLKQYDLARDSKSDDKISIFSTDNKWVWKPTYTPILSHTINLNILEHTLQNNIIRPKLVIDNNLSKTYYTLLQGHTYTLTPMSELASYFTENNVQFKIATLNGTGSTSILTEFTKNISYDNQNLIFEVPYNAPQRLYITISDKLNDPLFGFSLLVLPNDYEFNESIFKTRDYLDFKYNNIYYTQYKEDLPNAGYPMVGDALFEIRNLEQLPDIDLSGSSLFGIPNWDPSLRYREGDLVRWRGALYKAQRPIPAQAEFTTTVAGGVQSGDAITLTKYNKTIPLIGSTMMFSGIDQKYTFMELIEDTTDTYTAVLFPTVTQELSDLQNVVVTAPTPQRFDWLGDGDEEGIYYDDDYWLAQPEDSVFSVWLSDYDRFGFNVLQLMDYEDSTSYQVTDKITDIVAHEGVDTDPPKTRSYIQEICAGNEAGDLAMVKFAVDHTLKIGDYVLINGAVSNNNLNGIHRVYGFPEGVDDTGKSFADSMILIEQFIEENEYDCKLFVFKPTRFKTIQDLEATNNDNSYYWRDGNLAYVDKGVSGNWEVYKYNRLTGMQLWLMYGNDDYYGALKNGYGFNAFPDGTVNQLINRTHPQQVDSRAIDNVVIYNKEKNDILIELEVYDPFKGLIPGVADKELDFKSWYDPADYNTTTDPDVNLNTKTSWNNEFIGKTWWDLNTVRYYNYEQGPSSYRRKYWGKQFTVSTVDVYEWTKSPYHPSEYTSHIGEIFETKELSGTPYSVSYGLDTYYYYSTNVEFDPISRTYKEYYYFWVKDKSTIPHLPTRSLSVAEISAIIDNPTSRGIRWCAPISDNEIIVSNVRDIINENTVVQVNLNLTDDYQHSEWHLLRENDNNSFVPELFKLKMKQSLFGYREIAKIVEYYRLVDDVSEATDVNDIFPDYNQNTYKRIVQQGITENYVFKPGQLIKYNNKYWYPLKEFELYQNPMTPGQEDINQGLVLPTIPDVYYPWTQSPNYDFDNDGTNEWYSIQLDEHKVYLTDIWDPVYNITELDDTIINSEIFVNYDGVLESSIASSTLVGLIDRQEIPQKFANELSKYGNKILPNQSWIKNKLEARRIFVSKFNELIKEINIVDNLSYWQSLSNKFKFSNYLIGLHSYNLTNYWEYTNWYSSDYEVKTITDTILSPSELNSIQLGPNKVVKVINDGLADTAIYESILVANNYQWKKTYKEKGTIKLLDNLWDTRSENGYDVEIFDSTTFDSGPDVVFELLYNEITANIFTNNYESYYTDIWFSLIKYILQEQRNVDWIIKSSFIQLKLVSDGSVTPAVYTNSDEQILVDYVNAYKPYHTKVRKVFNTKVYYDIASINVEDFDPVISVTTPP